MNIFDEFPSKYIKASDLEGDILVTMTHITMEDIGDDRRPVLHFQEFEKGLVMNKTNSTNVSDIYTPETDAWSGKTMTMARAMTDFQGKSTPCIRLYPPKQGTAPAQQSQAPAQYDERNPPPATASDYSNATGG